MGKGLIIFGIVILVIGIVLSLSSYGNVQACQGTLTKVAGFFDPSVKSNCGTFSFLLYLGYGGIGLGVLLLLNGLVSKGGKKWVFDLNVEKQ